MFLQQAEEQALVSGGGSRAVEQGQGILLWAACAPGLSAQKCFPALLGCLARQKF